jgi:hypothetical protein
MRIRLSLAILLPAIAHAQTDVIERIRAAVLEYSSKLPNFVCTQMTDRQDGRPGPDPQWKTADRIEEQLSYFDHREKYDIVTINGKPPGKRTHDTLRRFRSSGEFGGTLVHIFEQATEAQFKLERSETVAGRPVHVISYSVTQPKSKIVVTQNKERAQIGYHGTIVADAETAMVLRLTAIGELPEAFPIRASSSEVVYEPTEIAGQTHLLPVRSITSIEAAKYASRNVITYTKYRKFDADAAVKFETTDKK